MVIGEIFTVKPFEPVFDRRGYRFLDEDLMPLDNHLPVLGQVQMVPDVTSRSAYQLRPNPLTLDTL